MIAHQVTTALISSTDATGATVVTNPANYWNHNLAITISAAATVTVQQSIDASKWVDVAASATSTSSVFLQGVFNNLRIVWTGNTGTLTVDMIQSDSNPNASR